MKPSDFHYFFLFCFDQFIHLFDVLVGQFLDLILASLGFILADLRCFLEILQPVITVPANVADGDTALLRYIARQLGQLFAPDF